jgi:ATP-dependent exoDNAse (exonuclease V) alpha subunit
MAKQARIEKNYKTRKKMWEKFYSIKELFADVKYIYASTIHKLQGSTYESVYIDFYNLNFLKKLPKEEFYRLFYVAITRASKDVKILIPNIFDDEISLESLQKEISKLFGGKILN